MSVYDHNCTRCPLHETAKTVCMEASGPTPRTRYMVVGEAPGRNEDETGVPFCGRAGSLLTSALFIPLKLTREAVWITNAVKCRPPDNRTPKQKEIEACLPFLSAEIEWHDPGWILALGNQALWALLRMTGISKVRGEWHQLDRERTTWIMPTYHPAFVLRQGNNSIAEQQFRDDIQMFAEGK